MESPRTCTNRGFTLVEVLVTLALVCGLVTLGLFMSTDMFVRQLQRSERDIVVVLLQDARSRSMNNFYQSGWGVCAEQSSMQYILFKGAYVPGAALNEQTKMHTGVVLLSPTFLCAHGGVVFSSLAATTTTTSISLVQNNSTTTISINYEGTIHW